MSTACDRLVHPGTTGEERRRQARLVGVLLGAPFLLGSAAAAALPGVADTSSVLGAIAGVFAGSWIMALIVASTGRRSVVEPLAVALGTLATGALACVAGATQSPLLLLCVALGFEIAWVSRSVRARAIATAAALAALMPAVAFQGMFSVPAGPAMHWLVMALYGGTLVLRIPARPEASMEGEQRPAAELSVTSLPGMLPLRFAANGEVETASQRCRDVLGVAPEMLFGGGLFERIHLADRIAYLNAIADLRSGQRPQDVTIRIRMPAEPGEAPGFRHFNLFFVAGEGQGDAILRDVESEAALRGELEAAHAAMEGVDEAKSRFLAVVSHELRTPLNAILGFSDMLAHEMFGPFADARQKEYVGLIHESGEHLLSVVNAILDVSKIEAGIYAITPEPFEMGEAAATCSAMMALQAAGRSVELVNTVKKDGLAICGDRRAVQQILINLLSNAIKFTPEGGTVRLSAARRRDRIEIQISDTGIGITEDDLSRLGRPFVQVRNDYTRKFEGAGLGLSLVKGLVSLHGGSFQLESRPGEGTIARVVLPVEGPTLVDGGEANGIARLPTRSDREEQHAEARKTA